MRPDVACVICGENSPHYRDVDGYAFHACSGCGSIHVDPELIHLMDQGKGPVGKYEKDYWEQERLAAVERAAGLALCRAGEAILYCRRPVRRFLDVGTGPGFLLRKLRELLDPEGEIFHGVEKFPPPYADVGPGFHHGDLSELEGKFDAGVCIEVVEHLTPRMLEGIAAGLARVSQPDSFWLFNTGMPEYVQDDPGYLDPLVRGHIVSYSLKAMELIFGRHGFTVGALPGKTFGFYVEYKPRAQVDFDTRIYQALPGNVDLLRRHELLYQGAFEAARSYLYYAGYLERTRWALALEAELDAIRSR